MSKLKSTEKLQHPIPAPIEFAGQWVAWNRERTSIVAHGQDMAEVHKAAVRAGHPDPILQRDTPVSSITSQRYLTAVKARWN
jgi:hypothetical protein